MQRRPALLPFQMGMKRLKLERGARQFVFRKGRGFKPSRLAAPSVKKFTKAVIKSKETGFVDLAVATYACDTTGSITLIATVPQGAGTSSRVGKKIMFKSIQGRGEFSAGSAYGLNHCALIIVYDRQPQGALPAITDILNTATSRSFNDDDASGRFTILKRVDEIVVGDNDTNPTAIPVMVLANFYLDLKDLPSTFKSAATGAIADIETGALYAITVGNVAAGLTAAALNIGYRTRYWDA